MAGLVGFTGGCLGASQVYTICCWGRGPELLHSCAAAGCNCWRQSLCLWKQLGFWWTAASCRCHRNKAKAPRAAASQQPQKRRSGSQQQQLPCEPDTAPVMGSFRHHAKEHGQCSSERELRPPDQGSVPGWPGSLGFQHAAACRAVGLYASCFLLARAGRRQGQRASPSSLRPGCRWR